MINCTINKMDINSFSRHLDSVYSCNANYNLVLFFCEINFNGYRNKTYNPRKNLLRLPQNNGKKSVSPFTIVQIVGGM